jgi:hypothetical protein
MEATTWKYSLGLWSQRDFRNLRISIWFWKMVLVPCLLARMALSRMKTSRSMPLILMNSVQAFLGEGGVLFRDVAVHRPQVHPQRRLVALQQQQLLVQILLPPLLDPLEHAVV